MNWFEQERLDMELRWRRVRIDEEPPYYAIQEVSPFGFVQAWRVLQYRIWMDGKGWSEWMDVQFEGSNTTVSDPAKPDSLD